MGLFGKKKRFKNSEEIGRESKRVIQDIKKTLQSILKTEKLNDVLNKEVITTIEELSYLSGTRDLNRFNDLEQCLNASKELLNKIMLAQEGHTYEDRISEIKDFISGKSSIPPKYPYNTNIATELFTGENALDNDYDKVCATIVDNQKLIKEIIDKSSYLHKEIEKIDDLIRAERKRTNPNVMVIKGLDRKAYGYEQDIKMLEKSRKRISAELTSVQDVRRIMEEAEKIKATNPHISKRDLLQKATNTVEQISMFDSEAEDFDVSLRRVNEERYEREYDEIERDVKEVEEVRDTTNSLDELNGLLRNYDSLDEEVDEEEKEKKVNKN